MNIYDLMAAQTLRGCADRDEQMIANEMFG